MKLIVQIPCFNEEATLADTIADIPRQIDGIDSIEIMVIDDGSTDQTVHVARVCGAEHILLSKRNIGLAHTFRRGIDACLSAGADIIVNTDGDNQYRGSDIAQLVQPILRGEADIVLGDRQTQEIQHFSFFKRRLQAFGSYVVQKLANTQVPDAVSGFRAISREAACKLNIVSSFSYTTEMMIQAGRRRMKVVAVPVQTNPKTRDSRLFKSTFQFVVLSIITMLRTYAMYQPLRMFFYLGLFFSVLGSVPAIRFLFFYLHGDGEGHIQSLVLGAAFLMMGFVSFMVGFVADLIAMNRQLQEMTLERVRRMDIRLQQTESESKVMGRSAKPL